MFNYSESADLPPLAWLAAINTNTGEGCVDHGRLVETREEFLVEGVWAGSFAGGGFDRYESFFGSGLIRRRSGEVVFVPSSATVDYLYYQIIADKIFCSNSLPFLLAALDDKLDEFNPEYSRINDSILKGIERYEQSLPTRRGCVSRLMYHNLVVKDGTVKQEAKPIPPEFGSFEDYRNYLAGNIAVMLRNAKDRARATPLRILSTQSTGYDSTAINALARDYGLDLALSIRESKERHGYFKRLGERMPRDSGEEIGRHLGIKIQLIDRRHFETDPQNEYIYWAGMHNNNDLNFHEVKEHVGSGVVLLTGVFGDGVWLNIPSTRQARLTTINDQLERGDLSGHGLSEARLHVGYIHAPVPYIGARSRRSLFNLANSEAMRPWSIGGAYDRPIPRRLGEEAGVPRELFGQTKLATAVELLPPYLPHGAPLRREFYRFIRRQRGIRCIWQIGLAVKLNNIIFEALRSTIRRRIRQRFPSSRLVHRIDLLLNTVQTTKSDGSIVPGFGDQWKAVLYAYCVNKTARFYEANRRKTELPRCRRLKGETV